MTSPNMLAWRDTAGADEHVFLVNNLLQGSSSSHSHEFYELVYVEDGFCLHFLDGAVDLLMTGDLVAIPPGQSHYYRCRQDVVIWNLLFMPQALDGVMDEVCALPGMADFFGGNLDQKLHVHLTLRDREAIQRIVVEAQAERGSGLPGNVLRRKALLIELIVLFSRVFGAYFPQKKATNPYIGYVMSAVSIIEEGYRGNLSVAGIAEKLGISPDHLTRQFRQLMGVTPTEYIRRQRFAKALDLLRKQHPVQEVCEATGFRHLSYFSREFKEVFNMTPTAFQKQAREKIQ